jgi:hypothetical protein
MIDAGSPEVGDLTLETGLFGSLLVPGGAAGAGVPEAQSMAQTGHRSPPVLRGYIRRGSPTCTGSWSPAPTASARSGWLTRSASPVMIRW